MPRLLLPFLLIFLIMHITGILAGSLPYIYNSLIVFTTTLIALLILTRWYSGKSMKEVIYNLGLHKTSLKRILPSILISLVLLLTYPFIALILKTELILHDDWLLNMIGICLTGGLAEELFFRGFLFRHLRAKMAFRKAVLTSMMLFTAAHLLMFTYMPWPVALLSTILAVAMSLPLAYLYESAENTVWSPALVHATVRSIGMVVTTGEDKFMLLSLLWMVGCMVLPYVVLVFDKGFLRRWRSENG